MSLPNCPHCQESYTYEDGNLLICPMCGFEWTQEEAQEAEEAKLIKDSNGNILMEGDSVTVIRDLKLGSSGVIKQGTKAKNIHLIADAVDGHDIEAKIDGIGKVYLKSSVVKK